MATGVVFSANNVPLPAAPPGYFVSGAHPDPSAGSAVPANHTSYLLTITTTGLTADQPLATIMVQYHYTNVVLFPGNVVDAGRVTNADGSQTIIPGTNSFTGWIDSCSAPMRTTHKARDGVTDEFFEQFGCDLQRIPNAYPDLARLLVLSSPGYASIPNVTLQLN